MFDVDMIQIYYYAEDFEGFDKNPVKEFYHKERRAFLIHYNISFYVLKQRFLVILKKTLFTPFNT